MPRTAVASSRKINEKALVTIEQNKAKTYVMEIPVKGNVRSSIRAVPGRLLWTKINCGQIEQKSFAIKGVEDQPDFKITGIDISGNIIKTVTPSPTPNEPHNYMVTIQPTSEPGLFKDNITLHTNLRGRGVIEIPIMGFAKND